MGWTSYSATEYKNGKIDRKAEIEKESPFIGKALKSAMVGSTYYAAVDTGKQVVGVVILTQVNGTEFGYKMISEFDGPTESKCPASIIALLSPTDNENALQWRAKCSMDKKANYLVRVADDIEYGNWDHFCKGEEFEVYYVNKKWYFGLHVIPMNKVQIIKRIEPTALQKMMRNI